MDGLGQLQGRDILRLHTDERIIYLQVAFEAAPLSHNLADHVPLSVNIHRLEAYLAICSDLPGIHIFRVSREGYHGYHPRIGSHLGSVTAGKKAMEDFSSMLLVRARERTERRIGEIHYGRRSRWQDPVVCEDRQAQGHLG